MKKICVLLIALTMLFALVSCGSSGSSSTSSASYSKAGDDEKTLGLFMESWSNCVNEAGYELPRLDDESDRFLGGWTGTIGDVTVAWNDRNWVEVEDGVDGDAVDEFCRWASLETPQGIVVVGIGDVTYPDLNGDVSNEGWAQAIYMDGELIYHV